MTTMLREERLPKSLIDWKVVRPHYQGDSEEIDACAGWILGAAMGDVDQPCGVFVTDRAFYVHVEPRTLRDAEVIAAPFATIYRCGAKGYRIVFIFDPVGGERIEDFQAVGVDLRPKRRGRHFAERAVNIATSRGATRGEVP